MLSKTAWFKILIVKIQNLRVLDRFKAQDRFKASKGTVRTCTGTYDYGTVRYPYHPGTAENLSSVLLWLFSKSFLSNFNLRVYITFHRHKIEICI